MLGLSDDLLQQSFTLLQAGDLGLAEGKRPCQPQPFVAKGGASGVRHHHRTQLLLVKLLSRHKELLISFTATAVCVIHKTYYHRVVTHK